MSALRHWSSKYITRQEGDALWVRADYLNKLRAATISGGRVETGETLVTGGKQYHAFRLADAASDVCECCLSAPCCCQWVIDRAAS